MSSSTLYMNQDNKLLLNNHLTLELVSNQTTVKGPALRKSQRNWCIYNSCFLCPLRIGRSLLYPRGRPTVKCAGLLLYLNVFSWFVSTGITRLYYCVQCILYCK